MYVFHLQCIGSKHTVAVLGSCRAVGEQADLDTALHLHHARLRLAHAPLGVAHRALAGLDTPLALLQLQLQRLNEPLGAVRAPALLCCSRRRLARLFPRFRQVRFRGRGLPLRGLQALLQALGAPLSVVPVRLSGLGAAMRVVQLRVSVLGVRVHVGNVPAAGCGRVKG